MKIVELSEASAPLSEYASDLLGEPIIVTKGGQPIAALMTLENVDMETISLSCNPQFIALIEQSRARHRLEGGIESDEMRRRLGLSKS